MIRDLGIKRNECTSRLKVNCEHITDSRQNTFQVVDDGDVEGGGELQGGRVGRESQVTSEKISQEAVNPQAGTEVMDAMKNRCFYVI